MNKRLKAIRPLKSPQLPHLNRELIIVVSILTGVITSSLLSNFNFDFNSHYLIGFTRSLLLSALLYCAMQVTCSIRVFTLMLFAFVSMTLDVLYLMAPYSYGTIFYFRYEHTYSFSNIYGIIELLALMYGGRGIALRYICNLFNCGIRLLSSKPNKSFYNN